MDVNTYLTQSIQRFKVKRVGYLPQTHMPYVVLDNDLTFHGLPKARENLLENMFTGIFDILKDLEFRYFQTNRSLKQHSNYQYKKGDVVVELGAYLGYYSMFAAKQVGSRGKVVSVELIPENYEVLKLNLSSNYPDNTIAINCGVHKAKGTQSAYLAGNQIAGFRKDVIASYAQNIQQIKVKMDTVDNILGETGIDAIDLMIIQVNGNELDALNGMSKSIQKVRNFSIAAPYNSDGTDHQSAVRDLLVEHGFKVDVRPPWVYASR